MGAMPGAPREVEGVEYAESALAPGLRMFACDRLSATLSTVGCSRRWQEAMATSTKRRRSADGDGDAAIDRFSACRGCALGAAHTGAVVVHYSPFFGADICPRCRKGVTRMIGGRVCVSCYNRERERTAGRNARGNAPTRLMPLRSIQFRAVIDGAGRICEARSVADVAEPMLQTLRTTPGKIAFAYVAPAPIRSQPELFAVAQPPRRAPRRRVPRRVQRLSTAVQGMLF